MQFPTHFSTPEIIWTTSAILGMLAGAFNIWVSRFQLGAVLRQGVVNGKRIIAVGRFTRDLIRIVIQALYLSAGILAGSIPSNPAAAGNPVVWILVASSILVTVMTATDAIERYMTTHLLEDRRSRRDRAEDLRMGNERRAMLSDREE